MSIKKGWFRSAISYFLLVVFSLASVRPVAAQSVSLLPEPGMMVDVSPAFEPCLMKGVRYHPEDPFRYDFLIDSGDTGLSGPSLKDESTKLIKYLLASLTTPASDLWVNLSPYEGERIIPDSFGLTEMGRDLLAQDYILKQITSSLLYPEKALGKKFWDRVYARTRELYGTTDVPVETFHKVWIVPATADIVVRNNIAYVVKAHLKLMLEKDYLATEKSAVVGQVTADSKEDVSTQIMREVILPELEREVNEGKNFSTVRQVYGSLILATWLKKKFLGQTADVKHRMSTMVDGYFDRNKTAGVQHGEDAAAQHIWQRYVEAFKKGVFNFIKEEPGLDAGETLPRKYFSGGADMAQLDKVLREVPPSEAGDTLEGSATVLAVRLDPVPADREAALVRDLWSDPRVAQLEGDLQEQGIASGAFQREETPLLWKSYHSGILPVYRHKKTGLLIVEKSVDDRAWLAISKLARQRRPEIVPIFLGTDRGVYYELYLEGYEIFLWAAMGQAAAFWSSRTEEIKKIYDKGLQGFFDQDLGWKKNVLVRSVVVDGQRRIEDVKAIDFEGIIERTGETDQAQAGPFLLSVNEGMHFSAKDKTLTVKGVPLVYVGRGDRNMIFTSEDGKKVYRVLFGQYLPSASLKEGFDHGAALGITPRAHEEGLTMDGKYYLVADYVDGFSLDRVSFLGEKQLGAVVSLVERAARAGLLLPDWRPANIMITQDGRALMADAEFLEARHARGARLVDEYILFMALGRYRAEWSALDPQGRLAEALERLAAELKTAEGDQDAAMSDPKEDVENWTGAILRAFEEGSLGEDPQVRKFLTKIGLGPRRLDEMIRKAGEEVVLSILSSRADMFKSFRAGAHSDIYNGIIENSDLILKRVRDEEGWKMYQDMREVLGPASDGDVDQRRSLVASYLTLTDVAVPGLSGQMKHVVVQEKATTLLERIRQIKEQYPLQNKSAEQITANLNARTAAINELLEKFFETFRELVGRGVVPKVPGFLVDVGENKENHVVIIDVADLLYLNTEEGRAMLENPFEYMFLPTSYKENREGAESNVFVDSDGELDPRTDMIPVADGRATFFETKKYSSDPGFDPRTMPAVLKMSAWLKGPELQALLAKPAIKHRVIYQGDYDIHRKIHNARVNFIQHTLRVVLGHGAARPGSEDSRENVSRLLFDEIGQVPSAYRKDVERLLNEIRKYLQQVAWLESRREQGVSVAQSDLDRLKQVMHDFVEGMRALNKEMDQKAAEKMKEDPRVEGPRWTKFADAFRHTLSLRIMWDKGDLDLGTDHDLPNRIGSGLMRAELYLDYPDENFFVEHYKEIEKTKIFLERLLQEPSFGYLHASMRGGIDFIRPDIFPEEQGRAIADAGDVTQVPGDGAVRVVALDDRKKEHIRSVVSPMLEKIGRLSRFVDYFLALDFTRVSQEDTVFFLRALKHLSGGLIKGDRESVSRELVSEFSRIKERHPELARWFQESYFLETPVLADMRAAQDAARKAGDEVADAIYTSLLSGVRNAESGETIGLDVELVNGWFTAGIFFPADALLMIGWEADLRQARDFKAMETVRTRFQQKPWVFLNKLKNGEVEALRFLQLPASESAGRFVIDAKAVLDQAQVTPGGIDLNTDRMEMNVTEEGAASFAAPAAGAGMSVSGEIRGFLPVIIGIEPAQNVRMILGLAERSAPSL